MKYVIAFVIILALLIVLQRGCGSMAERRWERKQERYEWRQDKKEERKENRGWRNKPEPDEQDQEHLEPERRRFFRRRER